MELLSSDRELGAHTFFFLGLAFSLVVDGDYSSVIESWVEDGEAGGHFFLLLSVSHKAFTEQGSKLSPEGEEGLSLYHEPIIVADMQGRYIDLTTNANVTFPSISYGNWLVK